MHKLFTYGTLRPAYGQEGKYPHLGSAKTRGRLYYTSWFPGAIFSDEDCEIIGDVLEVDDDELANLDLYEGFDPGHKEQSLFVRVIIPVTLEDGQEIECFAYQFNHETHEDTRIQTGDFLTTRK